MAKTWFESKYATPRQRLLFDQERAVDRATEDILELMEREGLNKAALARRLGKSKAYVTQALSGGRNMTLRTLAAFAWACGHSVRGIELEPIAKPKKQIPLEGSLASSWWTYAARVYVARAPRQPQEENEVELVAA